MKKVLSVILFLVLVAANGVFAFAAESSEISFNTSGPDSSGKVVVDVVVSGSCEPIMLQFCVAYDSEKLECVSVNVGSVFSEKTSPLMNVTDGKIFFIWDSLSPIKGGTILSIEFMQKADSGSASVWIDESKDLIVSDDSFVNVGVAGEKAEINLSKTSENTSSESSSVHISETTPEGSSEEESSSASESSEPAEEENNSGAETGYSKGIEIDKTDVTVKIGEEAFISVSGTDKNLVWYSSNESVVIVEDGKIIPVAPGTATVTVITEDWSGEATCIVTVVGQPEQEVSSESSESEPEVSSEPSESEQDSTEVIEVDSPRTEKESSSVWIWIVVALLACAIVFIVVFKKGINNKKGTNGGI